MYTFANDVDFLCLSFAISPEVSSVQGVSGVWQLRFAINVPRYVRRVGKGPMVDRQERGRSGRPVEERERERERKVGRSEL
jgi:hypothetical protein